MPEEINGRKTYSLLEITQSIQKMFNTHYSNSFWIKAEMNKLGYYAQSGHCFPELVEKQEGRIIAKIDSLIWKKDYDIINLNFKRVLNEPLKDGIKILFLAKVEYSPEYGLKLRISDIDPSFTLGDFELEKQETLKRLHAEKIYNLNRLIEFPLLPKRIAIISDKDSRGYQDFIDVIDKARETWNYNFFCMLFPAALQGDKAIATIPAQLSKINKVRNHFDVVAILRGGGGEISFACYNNFKLSKAIATFPLPIVTGIGHVTNITVADMVANQNFITPTKLAEFLIQKFHEFLSPVREAEQSVIYKTRRLIADEKTNFRNTIKYFRSVTSNILVGNKNDIKQHSRTLIQQSQFKFMNEREQMNYLNIAIGKESITTINSARERINQITQDAKQSSKSIFKTTKIILEGTADKINLLSPQQVMKRGYSMTMSDGKLVKSISQLREGKTLNTILFDGTVVSTVNSTTKTNDQ